MRTTKEGRPMHVVVLGGGPTGLTAAMLLAGEGHRVTLLDKDSGGPGTDAEQAWDQWRRPGVNQFRHPHIMLPGGYQLLSTELPDAITELRALGARTHNMLDGAFDLAAIGGRKPGDERFDTLAARRPVIEQGLGNAAARAGVTVIRGTAVAGFLTDGAAASGIPHITGVRTAQGEEIHADLVVDALGRNSPASKMLTDIGAATPVLDKHETGFLAYSRYFRSADGSYPEQAAWPLEHHDSLGLTTVPGDAGTWALALFVSAKDRAMRALSEPEVWQRVAALYPGMAQWASHGEPLTGVLAMSGMEARHRRFIVDGKPVVTGLLSIGDAWATTNPTFGFGLTMGMSHGLLLRDVLREVGIGDREKLALRFDEITNATLGPTQQASAAWDLHRLAQIDLEIDAIPYQDGITYRTDDEDWNLRQALEAAKLWDPDVLRAFGDVGSGLSSPEETLARPGVLDRIKELGSGAAGYPEPGPFRAELLTVIGAK
ncbi:NAD(P)/FAD-dependent oxidoreductase [Nocardia sp. GCM10030253]|uniref:NAD(P)/FAD-dependent oxidoreductase n=1 Tax=Nocardia sp. GCM10030253 TaxID=3273404 RepID=UPI0036315CCB